MTTTDPGADKAVQALIEALEHAAMGYAQDSQGHTERRLNDARAKLRAALTHRQQGVVGQWQPIETRPTGHYETYLVTNGAGQVAPWSRGVIHNNPGTQWDWNYGDEITQWMPLPPAPDAALTASPPAQPQEPVAWCALTPSGKIAYFDGKPMVMVGPVGNEHHPDPLYASPPRAVEPMPALTDEQIEEIARTVQPITTTGHPSWEHAVIRAYEAARGIGKQGQG